MARLVGPEAVALARSARRARGRGRRAGGRSGGRLRPLRGRARRAAHARFGAFLVVELLPALALARLRCWWKPQVGEGRPQVEARPADDDRRASRLEDLVDRSVCEPLILGDGASWSSGQIPTRRAGDWFGEDRQPPVDLHRVGRDELRRDPLGRGPGQRRSSRSGRAEDRENGAQLTRDAPGRGSSSPRSGRRQRQVALDACRSGARSSVEARRAIDLGRGLRDALQASRSSVGLGSANQSSCRGRETLLAERVVRRDLLGVDTRELEQQRGRRARCGPCRPRSARRRRPRARPRPRECRGDVRLEVLEEEEVDLARCRSARRALPRVEPASTSSSRPCRRRRAGCEGPRRRQLGRRVVLALARRSAGRRSS